MSASPRTDASDSGSFSTETKTTSSETEMVSPETEMVAPESESPFQIGICLAGAATGGAYTAGVMDFLLEALGEWKKAKVEAKRNPNAKKVPEWKVKITELTGTSAGGLNAVLAVNAINTGHEPLPRGHKANDDAPRNNCLYKAWVKEMKYEDLFATSDLTDSAKVTSLLSPEFMPNIVNKIFQEQDWNQTVPAWASDLHLCLTVTNLAGVPYVAASDFDEFFTWSVFNRQLPQTRDDLMAGLEYQLS